jgi:hypothetical protein
MPKKHNSNGHYSSDDLTKQSRARAKAFTTHSKRSFVKNKAFDPDDPEFDMDLYNAHLNDEPDDDDDYEDDYEDDEEI